MSVGALPDSAAAVAKSICPGAPLDLGIVHAVKVLRDAGVQTYESCEGGDGHAYPAPTVRFHGGLGEGWRALAACQVHRLPVRDLSRVWDLIDNCPTGPYWQVTFRGKVV